MLRRTLAMTSVLALAATSACSGDESGGDDLTSITVGAIPIVDVAPLHLAKEQGFFEDHGLKVEIKNTSGGAEAIPGVNSGSFDFAFGNITSLIIAREKGLPLKVVSNGVTSTGKEGADFGGVVVPEDSSISSARDLAGAKIAVNNLENIGDTTVRNSIREDGGDPSNVEFVEMPFPDMPAALEQGELDAAWVVEPFRTTALDDGTEEVASNFVDADPSLSIASYFTREELIDDNPELIESFTAAMHESLSYADSRPEEVRRILTTYTDMDETLIEEIQLPAFPTEGDRDSAQRIGELMVKDGLIDSKPDTDELFL
ncbi:NitT/TauT family transport system substrate-binding protein [Haloactinospora alba]|uniref:NitT/TauT family transport system substrate-binding protein n=1 Tax=Haloactinospora alba TaxID=405555 RepID=A0A543NH82_9ACTN|nr:ABC transporter substrate-binding protein [Haloactinospora alba]TQN31134.1 NitT/TauT family transport system substrate-binding protein [Haloactinospora alba]